MKKNNFCIIKKLFFSLILSSILSFTGCTSNENIITSNTLDLIWNKLPELDDNSLVVFDVDETLITTIDNFFQLHKKRVSIWKRMLLYYHYTKYSHDFLLSRISHLYGTALYQASNRIIDQKTPLLIKKLKDKNVKIVALTSCPTGPHDDIKKVEDWRMDQLESFGFDFRNSFPRVDNIIFNNLSKKRPPLFYNGVLFANLKTDKGPVLREFLNKIKCKPNFVIFVDDSMRQVKSVRNEMKKLNINFVGIHYIASNKFSNSLDLEVIKLQIKNLVKQNKFISDKEAKQELLSIS
jgi:hypothetical protein